MKPAPSTTIIVRMMRNARNVSSETLYQSRFRRLAFWAITALTTSHVGRRIYHRLAQAAAGQVNFPVLRERSFSDVESVPRQPQAPEVDPRLRGACVHLLRLGRL